MCVRINTYVSCYICTCTLQYVSLCGTMYVRTYACTYQVQESLKNPVEGVELTRLSWPEQWTDKEDDGKFYCCKEFEKRCSGSFERWNPFSKGSGYTIPAKDLVDKVDPGSRKDEDEEDAPPADGGDGEDGVLPMTPDLY